MTLRASAAATLLKIASGLPGLRAAGPTRAAASAAQCVVPSGRRPGRWGPPTPPAGLRFSVLSRGYSRGLGQPRERLELGHGLARPLRELPYLSVPALPSQGPAQAVPGVGRAGLLAWGGWWQPRVRLRCLVIVRTSPTSRIPEGPSQAGTGLLQVAEPLLVGQDRPSWPAEWWMPESRRDRAVNSWLCCPASLRLRLLPSVVSPQS